MSKSLRRDWYVSVGILVYIAFIFLHYEGVEWIDLNWTQVIWVCSLVLPLVIPPFGKWLGMQPFWGDR